MTHLIIEKFPRVLKNKSRLEKYLNVKISVKGQEVTINGKPENEYIAEKVLEALDFGFPLSVALLIKQHDYLFEALNIKDLTKRKDLGRVRARIIGKNGKALRTLSNLTECYFELKDNSVGIIGHPENIKTAQEGISSLIRGAKHGNVYSYLEKHQTKEVVDLGLKKKQ